MALPHDQVRLVWDQRRERELAEGRGGWAVVCLYEGKRHEKYVSNSKMAARGRKQKATLL
jgi:hypothetical protein